MDSVKTRRDAFADRALEVDPTLSDEMLNLLWVEYKLSDERQNPSTIQNASAQQYVTYLNMRKITPQRAFMRALQLDRNLYEERLEAQHKKIPFQRIKEFFSRAKGQQEMFAKTACQWSTGGRHVDLEILLRKHIVYLSALDAWMIVLVGGKTDLQSAGQPVLIGAKGIRPNVFGAVLNWLRLNPGDPEDLVFPSTDLGDYNKYLKAHLGSTSRYIRHAALTRVAEVLTINPPDVMKDPSLPMFMAQSLGRHKSEASPHHYVDQHLWAEGHRTLPATEILQRL